MPTDLTSRAIKIGTVLAVLVTITQLYDWLHGWLSSEGAKLTAVVACGRFVPPRGPSDNFDAAFALVSTDSLDSLIARVARDERITFFSDSVGESTSRRRLARELHFVLDDTLRLLREHWRDLEGYWQVTIRNEGKVALRDIAITLPYSRIALVNGESGPSFINVKRDELRLGNLRPQDMITIYAWTMMEPKARDAQYVKLVHESGIGDVSVLMRLPQPWPWIARNWIVVIAEFVLALSLLGLLGVRFWRLKSRTEETVNAKAAKGADVELPL